MPKKTWRWLVLGVMAVVFMLFFALGGSSLLSFGSLRERQAELQSLVQHRPVLIIPAFVGIYIMTTALSLPGAAILTLAAGALFGVVAGGVIALGSSLAGATLAFLSARYVLRGWIEHRFRRQLVAINHGLERDGVFHLVTLRLVAVIPFFVINLAMGVTRIRLLVFVLASFVGMIPGTVVYVNAGTRLGELKSASEILSLPVLASFAALAVLPWIAKAGLRWWNWRKTSGRYPVPTHFAADVVVIGAGSAGLTAASVAAQLGAQVVLVERARMGGECLNTGCVPSKSLIRCARDLIHARRMAAAGLAPPPAAVDLAVLMRHVHDTITQVAPHDSRERFRALGVDCRTGDARLTSPHTVVIDGESISTRAIVVATGASPRVPDLPGLADLQPLTSDTVWSLRTLPRRLVVVGGGPVGCELAQCFARFGSLVTIVSAPGQLLEKEDQDIAAVLEQRFRAEGIRLMLGEEVVRGERDGADKVVISIGETGIIRHTCDEVLIALGKHPTTAGLGLAELGVILDRGGRIVTDDQQRTNFTNIYACGDVSSKNQFTHVAADQAWRAAANAVLSPFSHQRHTDTGVPWITFTDPEVGRVGINVAQASKQGIAVDITLYDLADNDRAIVEGEAYGFVKIISERGRDRILGAAVVGAHAGELISVFAFAIAHQVGLARLSTAVHAYPSWGEAASRAAAAWRRAHTPPWQRRVVAAYLTLRRTPAHARTMVMLLVIAVLLVTAGMVVTIRWLSGNEHGMRQPFSPTNGHQEHE